MSDKLRPSEGPTRKKIKKEKIKTNYPVGLTHHDRIHYLSYKFHVSTQVDTVFHRLFI